MNLVKVVLTCCLMIVMVVQSGYAENGGSLSEDYPNEQLFLAMMMRGANDFSTINQRFAVDVDEFVSAGYTSYYPPASNGFQYYIDGDRAVCYSGDQGYTDGRNERGAVTNRIRVLPKEEPFTIGIGSLPVVENGEVVGFEEVETKSWTYNGSEWYDMGCSWETVAEALRFERIWAHITWASSSYQAVSRDMPVDFNGLETFIGVDRNPAAWAGVNMVDSPDAVRNAVGNLFVGWVGEDWIVSLNVGPAIRESVFERDACSLMYSCGYLYY